MSRHPGTVVFCIILLAGCASTPSEVPEEPGSPPGEITIPDGSEVVTESLANIAIGSPESLDLAFLDLGLSNAGETARGIELRNVVLQMYDIVYPLLEPPGETRSPLSPASLFLPLFEAVRKGEYHTVAQADIGFLTLVLPTLAVLTTADPAIAARSRATLVQAESLGTDSVLPDLLLGIIAERSGLIEEASDRYDSAVRKSPRCYPATMGLARIAVTRGDAATAVTLVESLNSRLTPDVSLLELTARAYLLSGRTAEADLLALEALKRSNSIPLVLLRAQILVAAGNFAQARPLLSIVERRRPDDVDVLLLKTEMLVADGSIDESLSTIRRARELYPANQRVRDVYGRLLVLAGESEAGREILEASLGDSPRNRKNLEVLLDDALAGERFADAAEYLNRLLAIDERREYHDQAVEVNLQLGDLDAAVGSARRSYELQPGDLSALTRFATLLIESGAVEEPRELLEKAIGRTSDGVTLSAFHYLLSLLATTKEERYDLLRTALYQNYQNFDALVAYSALYREDGDVTRARRYLRQAAELQPENEEIRTMLEELMREEGN